MRGKESYFLPVICLKSKFGNPRLFGISQVCLFLTISTLDMPPAAANHPLWTRSGVKGHHYISPASSDSLFINQQRASRQQTAHIGRVLYFDFWTTSAIMAPILLNCMGNDSKECIEWVYKYILLYYYTLWWTVSSQPNTNSMSAWNWSLLSFWVCLYCHGELSHYYISLFLYFQTKSPCEKSLLGHHGRGHPVSLQPGHQDPQPARDVWRYQGLSEERVTRKWMAFKKTTQGDKYIFTLWAKKDCEKKTSSSVYLEQHKK